MSAWHPSINIPAISPIDNPFALLVTAAALIMTAPDPVIGTPLEITVAEVYMSAPDPEVLGTLGITTAALVMTAPDPERVADGVLGVPTAEAFMTADDPQIIKPFVLIVDAANAALTTVDPDILYGYVTNESELNFQSAPSASTRGEEHRRQLAGALTNVMQGKLACTGTMRLLPDVPATFLRDARLGIDSMLRFDPLTASALAEVTVQPLFTPEANRSKGQWLITHATDAATDRRFRYLILG